MDMCIIGPPFGRVGWMLARTRRRDRRRPQVHRSKGRGGNASALLFGWRCIRRLDEASDERLVDAWRWEASYDAMSRYPWGDDGDGEHAGGDLGGDTRVAGDGD